MTKEEIRRRELSELLRTRRARLSPLAAGLPDTGRRRTPGLRREEVAHLAGMSATWYTWLEQERPIQVSRRILESLARVLKLEAAERIQLFQLALPEPAAQSPARPEPVTALVRRMLDRLDPIPAFIMGRRWDVLAWNQAARAFYFDFEQILASERNLIWLLFTNPAIRNLMVDWSARARDGLARFRADYGRHAGDPYFVQLVERLKTVSSEFAEWWPRYDIQPMTEGRREYNHPLGGRMVVEHTTFIADANPEHRLLLLLAAGERGSIEKMRKVVEQFREGASSSSSRVRRPGGARKHLR